MKENFVEVVFTDIETSIMILKTIFLAIATYWTIFKITNKKQEKSLKNIARYFVIAIAAILSGILRYETNLWLSTICLVLLISTIYSKENFGKSIIITIISLSINYAIMLLAVIIDFVISLSLGITNNYIALSTIIIIHTALLIGFFKIKKFKYGFSFLTQNNTNGSTDLIVLNIGISILLIMILNSYTDNNIVIQTFTCFIMFAVMMIINIQKSLQTYYKQKLLTKELEETKKELGDKNQEVYNLEEEILNFSKKSHSLAHKQKALEYKLNQLNANMEIAEEIDGISKELYSKKVSTELTKTGITEIDNMLNYMRSECEKNNIDFELKVTGNIYYMINNLISKEDLEILLADHIKDAIIAIQHTDNINKSILVKLGQVGTCYGIYIYDSGVEFDSKVIAKLGKEPITTYAKEGGSGMGFMNTFDTIKKYNASFAIKEIGEPSENNFTKAIMIEFNNKVQNFV